MAEIAKPPKVFISYAWEDDFKTWVLDFATHLRSDGINAILDQWETVPGDQLPEFMEKSVRESDFVLFVCTPTYKRKSDRRKGGVGYEGHIITGEVFQKNNHRKFIPVLRKGKWATAAPSWAISKLFIDFRGDSYSEANYQQLLNTLFGKSPTAPPLRDDTLREKLEREAAENAEREKVENEKIEREAAERLAYEKAARDKAEKDAVEKARLEAEELARQKVAKEKAEREAAEKAIDNTQNQTVAKIQPEILKKLPSQGKRIDKDIPIAQKSQTEKLKSSSTKTRRKSNTAIIVALIGLAGTIIAALLGSPIIEKWFSPALVPTEVATSTVTLTSLPVTPSKSVEPSVTPTKTFTITPSKTKEPTSTPTPQPTMFIQSSSGTSGDSPFTANLKIVNIPEECSQRECEVLWEVSAYGSLSFYSSSWVSLDARKNFTYTFTKNPRGYWTINDYVVTTTIRYADDEVTIQQVATRIYVQ